MRIEALHNCFKWKCSNNDKSIRIQSLKSTNKEQGIFYNYFFTCLPHAKVFSEMGVNTNSLLKHEYL